MYVKKIKSFIVLATSTSFRDAADKLNITQPTLTKQIQLLEERLGFLLFLRDNQGCYLTDEGKIIYNYAINLTNELDKFLCVAKKIKTGRTGILNVGHTFSFINILPKLLNKYTEHHPMVRIKIYDLNSGELEKGLISGELDVAFMEKPSNKQLMFEEMGTDHLLIISNKENNFQLNQLADLIPILDKNTLCLPNNKLHSDLFQKISKFLSTNSLHSSNIHYTNNIYSTISMTELHSNIAILANSLVQNIKTQIKYERLTGRGTKWKIGMCWNEVKASTQALTLINEIKNENND
ncbi:MULTISPECIES: LysR family transcriptional regulator [unclassified Gilliamella]|uniref:LysR family transcriptional regulator n=1 Tax=unclassified Gilliamella TaxID=2685620 RepID=UPI00132C052A|nr:MULTISPECIES: LysR family transcriptional regulator [unclassified Gilliamella]MWN32774.1 LysR family transcriptional regulator [Gilliamella sp. Pra-s60]MWP30192.1 LysR family transcriptional regulator [Gilliamella sp. Pra-s54]